MGLFQPHERHRGRARQAGLNGARLSKPPKAIVVHSLAQAQAALAAGTSLGLPLTLLSGPGAASYAGAAWFLEVVRQARLAHPGADAIAILDCADQPGRALSALRLGVQRLRLGGNRRARTRVAAIAEAMGAELDETRYEVLDLAGVDDLEAAAAEFLRDGGVSHPSRRRFAPPQDDARGLSSTNETRHPEERSSVSVSMDEGRRTSK